MSYFLLIIGVAMLLYGGDWLVKASVEIALRARISMLVVGMTIVSFATSAPELFVSVKAGIDGYQDISFGNVLGSNIANIALILGLTAMIYPVYVKEKSIRIDYWLMLGVTALLFVLVMDGGLVFWDGVLMVVLLIIYNVVQVRLSRKRTVPQEVSDAQRLSLGWMIFYLLGGIAALGFGSDFLVQGAVEIAARFGLSERLIGLTIVSIGTSLPELAASLVASFKGERDMSLGNLIGSNIFNILAVLGITSMIIDLPVKSPQLLSFDFPALFIITLILFPLIGWLQRGVITRWQGFLLFLAYAVYFTFVIIQK